MKTNHIYSGSDEILSLDTEMIDKLDLLHDNILLAKCANDHIRYEDGNILIAHTDDYIDRTLWCEILKIGKECKYLTEENIGDFMIIPEWEGRGWNRIGPSMFILSEKLMDKKNPLLKPFVITKD